MKKIQAEELLPEKNDLVSFNGSPAEIIKQAITGGCDLEKLEKLLILQERFEANEAKKAYHRAMTAFKLNPPEIEKDKKVSYGTTKYSHATLANVTQKINEALSKHGLSASWNVNQNGAISVTCRITHEQGHSEETTLTAPADASGSKNAIQSIGSTITYLERYSLLALTGLATHEMDDDGKASTELITKEEAKEVMDELVALNTPIDLFLKYMKIEKMEDMPKSDLKKARIAIETKKSAVVK